MTLGIMTFRLTALSKMTQSIMTTLNIITFFIIE